MFVDASAIVAMMAGKREAADMLKALEHAHTRITSPVAVWESSVAVARLLNMSVSDAVAAVDDFLLGAHIALTSIDGATARHALDAFDRFGKGRHPAGLNMGDCFAYACARQLALPLLYKGDDFALTDIEPA